MALSKEDKKDVAGAMGKALANKVAKVTRDRTINLIPARQDSSSTEYKRVDATRVTAKDWSTKRRALRGIAETAEAKASGYGQLHVSNRAGYRKTHRERQKTGEAGSKGFIPYRREN